MVKNYTFQLEQSPAKKGLCNNCKTTNSFRYYKNLPREYGICDKVNKCAYHNNPNKENIERKIELKKMVENIAEAAPVEKVKIVFPNPKFIESTLQNQKTIFHIDLKEKLKIPSEHFTKRGVGGFNDYTNFVYQTKEKAINVKSVLFLPGPKRNKESENSIVYLKAKKGEKYERCLFGEHLLTNKIVCLVESEKTAVIASYFYPQFDWLATGSANGLTDNLVSVLYDKEVYYLPDSDEAGRNNSTIKKLEDYEINYKVIDLFPNRTDGYDLADAILEGLRPEIKPSISIASGEQKTIEKEKSKSNVKHVPTKNISEFEKVERFISERFEIRFNEVSNEIEYKKKDTEADPFEILNTNNLYRLLQHNYINFSQAKLSALLGSDFVLKYNPFKDYFEKLGVWNENDTDYISLLCSYLPVRDQDRKRLFVQFKKALVRCVACALVDSVFNKQAFILVHDMQNSGKSTFVRWLCPPVLSEYITENISTDKDSLICLSDNLIINMDELATLNRTEINTLKAMMSKDVVKVRRPYDKKPIMTPRRASFFGSTNKSEFLSDETGSVRWLCFELTKQINFDYKKDIDINNVWKQAYTLFKQGFKYELSPEEIKENDTSNKEYQIVTDEQELINTTFAPGKKDTEDYFLTATEIKLLLKNSNGLNNLSSVNIGKALKILGFERVSKRNDKINMSIKGYYVTIIKSEVKQMAESMAFGIK